MENFKEEENFIKMIGQVKEITYIWENGWDVSKLGVKLENKEEERVRNFSREEKFEVAKILFLTDEFGIKYMSSLKMQENDLERVLHWALKVNTKRALASIHKIHEFLKPKQFLDFAKKAAFINPKILIPYISQNEYFDEDQRFEIFKICMSSDSENILDNVVDFNIMQENNLLELSCIEFVEKENTDMYFDLPLDHAIFNLSHENLFMLAEKIVSLDPKMAVANFHNVKLKKFSQKVDLYNKIYSENSELDIDSSFSKRGIMSKESFYPDTYEIIGAPFSDRRFLDEKTSSDMLESKIQKDELWENALSILRYDKKNKQKIERREEKNFWKENELSHYNGVDPGLKYILQVLDVKSTAALSAKNISEKTLRTLYSTAIESVIKYSDMDDFFSFSGFKFDDDIFDDKMERFSNFIKDIEIFSSIDRDFPEEIERKKWVQGEENYRVTKEEFQEWEKIIVNKILQYFFEELGQENFTLENVEELMRDWKEDFYILPMLYGKFPEEQQDLFAKVIYSLSEKNFKKHRYEVDSNSWNEDSEILKEQLNIFSKEQLTTWKKNKYSIDVVETEKSKRNPAEDNISFFEKNNVQISQFFGHMEDSFKDENISTVLEESLWGERNPTKWISLLVDMSHRRHDNDKNEWRRKQVYAFLKKSYTENEEERFFKVASRIKDSNDLKGSFGENLVSEIGL